MIRYTTREVVRGRFVFIVDHFGACEKTKVFSHALFKRRHVCLKIFLKNCLQVIVVIMTKDYILEKLNLDYL